MIVAVDIGGTNIRCALVNLDNNQLTNNKKWSRSSGEKIVPEVFVRLISDYVGEVEQKEKRIDGISIALAGSVDFNRRKVLIADNIGWYDLPLSNLIEQETGYITTIETDVICGAIGEVRKDTTLSKKIVAYIAIGTGIGHCIMIGGRVLLGDTRSANRLGHICINKDGPKCYCGKNGCLCQYSSGEGMVKRLDERNNNGLSTHSTKEIIELARNNNKTEIKVLEEALSSLSTAIAHVVTIINPTVVLIAGGVTSSEWPNIGKLSDEINKNITEVLSPVIKYGCSPTTANLIGAAHVGNATLCNKTEELYL